MRECGAAAGEGRLGNQKIHLILEVTGTKLKLACRGQNHVEYKIYTFPLGMSIISAQKMDIVQKHELDLF